MRVSSLLFLVALLFATATLAAVDETPSIGRGIAADKLYQFGDVDSVDLQTGALSVAIPIGTSYPVSERFSYSFTLTYNSRVWDYRPVPQPGTGYFALPNQRSNAGIGWSFHLGLLIPPLDPSNPTGTTQWKYVSPEGGEHVFFDRLHDDDLAAAEQDPTNSYFYTHDSSYLRLKFVGGNPDVKEVEFPDGTIKKFELLSGTTYRLKEIRDRFPLVGGQPPNWVRIAYSGDSLTWTITDSHSRTHTVKFFSATYGTGTRNMVDYVDLATFNNSISTWNFLYRNDGTSSLIWRDCQDALHPAQRDVNAPVLASIVRPDGTTWTLSHYDDSPSASCNQSEISSLALPTGGSIEYEYQTIQFPANDPCASQNPDMVFLVVQAIKTRTFKDNVVQNPAPSPAVWEYQYSWSPSPGFDNYCTNWADDALPEEEQTVTVWNPIGDKTEYFFSVWPLLRNSPNGFRHGEYGLPFTRLQPTSGGRFLSSETFDCDPDRTHCGLARSEYVLYEQDATGVRSNRRILGQRTVYNDDLDTFADTAYSQFDGVGHYRKATLSGSFGSGDSQDNTTNYNPLRLIYPDTYVVLPATDPWVLGTFSYVDANDGVDTSRKSFDFDTTTGFLKSVRTHKTGTTVDPLNDLYTLYCPDGMGNVLNEYYYGGDGAFSLPATFATCTTGNLSTGLQYRLVHTYSSGVRNSSKYSTADLYFLNLTIDSKSGLPSKSFDVADVETQIEYDGLGRLTRSRPMSLSGLPRDAQTEYTYSPSNIVVRTCDASLSNCLSGTPLTYEKQELDGFGRLWHLKRDMPAPATQALQITRYNAMGWKERQSSWFYDSGQYATENDAPATKWEDYDPFGRPGKVKQADNSETTYSYEGVRWVGTDQNVALAIDGTESCVRKWERFDRQGRLDRVEEAYGGCGTGSVGQKTQYSFDEVGHLTKVCQDETGTPPETTCGQTRYFNYDNRGFLISEKHPEKGGAGGNGFVTYSCFDAKGHNRYRDDGISTRRLAYSFDPAERLTLVQTPAALETCSNQLETGTAWKVFTYATINNTVNGLINARKGKLETAKSRNEIGAPPTPGSVFVDVTESYTYQDRGGRAKKRLTSVSGTSGTVAPEEWATSQSTTSLGLLDTLDYPTCTSGTGCLGGPGAISTTMGYEDGMLRTVTAGASSPLVSGITYHASGMPAVVSHGPSGNESLIETVSQAANGMPRPSSIAITSRDGSTFTTGTYSYDGAGNIKAMGNATIGTDRFKYDRYHRLVEAQMATVGAGISQTATFDAYGNITAMNTNGTGMNFPASGSTNRLSSATYDEAGNILSWNGNSYSWDRFNRMTRWSNGSETWSYVYTAGDERLWAIKGTPSSGYSTWTLRGFDNAVLVRDQRQPATAAAASPELVLSICPSGTPSTRLFCDNFESGTFGPWNDVVAGHEAHRRTTRYAYRDGRLLLSLDSDSGFHDCGLDHLGSVRVSTDDVFGTIAARHTYFPFGQEATSVAQDDEVMKFTGHERDLQSTPGDTADDLDYMHARFRSPLTARFLSTDTVLGLPRTPQSWNRYSYVGGSPLNYSDPNGMERITFSSSMQEATVARLEARYPAFRATLDRFRGPGTPDAHYERSRRLSDPTTGERAFGLTSPKLTPGYEGNWGSIKGDSELFPATGAFVTNATLTSVTVTIDEALTPGSKEEANVIIHEGGHMESAASDPVGYLRRTATDSSTGSNGKPLGHDKQPEEKRAMRYRDDVCGATKNCTSNPEHTP